MGAPQGHPILVQLCRHIDPPQLGKKFDLEGSLGPRIAAIQMAAFQCLNLSGFGVEVWGPIDSCVESIFARALSASGRTSKLPILQAECTGLAKNQLTHV